LDEDFSEARDVAAEHPEVLADLIRTWEAEAERNNVLPLKDDLVAAIAHMLTPPYPRPATAVFRPGGSDVRDESVPILIMGGSITARVQVPGGGAQGIMCALGDWTGGFALY